MQDVWFRKCDSFEEEEEADREFWEQMTGRERVEALEELRREAWKITGERFEGLRRVARVLEISEDGRRRLLRTLVSR
jgi:hypothetical protein